MFKPLDQKNKGTFIWNIMLSYFQALDGFVLVVTSDGTILYSTENISSHLGFHQVDLVHRCLYGIVHPDDHHELKVVLEQTLPVVSYWWSQFVYRNKKAHD